MVPWGPGPGCSTEATGRDRGRMTMYLGPLSVRGPVGLTHADGRVEVVAHAVLCRCGQSAEKPWCDGRHAHVRFRAPGVQNRRP